ncbi:MAG: Gfo/Idh/MocA family protein [Thermoguttaceae bacterium]
MTDVTKGATPRREFLKNTGRLAAASALAGVIVPHVHAAEDNTIRLALIGTGGRGSGAVGDALSSPNGPAKLYAMADLFADRLEGSYKALSNEFGDKIDVPKERQFLGFDAYRKAIDCLRPCDVALLTTYSGFRAAHMEYAVEKGVNIFMEKCFAGDPGGVQRILRAGEAAEKKNLKVATGLMCRHSSARHAMIHRIRDGAMGQIELIRTYRMDSGHRQGPYDKSQNELLWQIRRPDLVFWYGTGVFVDWTIHLIDECCWIKDAWPVSAHGVGGRVANSPDCGQSLDSYSVEYTFPDGTKAMATTRYIPNCFNDFATFLHGAKCGGQFSGNIHAPTAYMCKDQRISPENTAWKPEREKISPYRVEWNELLDAIRRDRPHNETQRSAYSNLAAIMGQAAVHMGRIITWEEAMASKFQFCSNAADLTIDSPAPVHADAQGRYPVPVPGVWSEL